MSDLAVAQNWATPAQMIVPVSKLLAGGAAADWRDCDPREPRGATGQPARVRVIMLDVTFDAYRGHVITAQSPARRAH
jgi:hypothetical protein